MRRAAAVLASLVLVQLWVSAPVSSERSVKKAKQTADFIRHVEKGYDVAETVVDVKNVADVVTDGWDEGDAVELGKVVGEDLVRDKVRGEFFDVIDKHVGGEAAEDVTKKTAKKAAKKAVKN